MNDVEDLAAALAREDAAEDAGTLQEDDRLTCHRHRAWATPEHMALLLHRDPAAAVASAVLASHRGPQPGRSAP